MNKVMLIGNLTRDPEINTTNSGVSVCRFSLAVQRRFANADNGPQADFFNIVVWRGQAENCHKFLKKGSKCCIIGKIQNSSYEKDGVTRYTTEIVADEVEFLNSRNGDGESTPVSGVKSATADTAELEPIEDDDSLPF